MQKSSMGKALLFSVLAGIVASMAVVLIASSFPTTPARARRSNVFTIAVLVPVVVGGVYRKFKADLKIFDRVIVVVLSLVLAYSGLQLGITRLVGNPGLRRWIDARDSPFFAVAVILFAIFSTVLSSSSWGYGPRRRSMYPLDKNFDRHD